jgi:putative CocE/NonD family hydrolase
MRKRLSIFLLTAVISGSAGAQNFYFPRSKVKDSSLLAQAMPELARTVMKRYKIINGTDAYYNNLFRAQLIAGEYEKAISSIEEYRKTDSRTNSLGPYAYLQYELFAKGNLQSPRPFEETFRQDFARTFRVMNNKTAFSVGNIFRTDLNTLNQRMQSALAALPPGDSVSFKDALTLLRVYSACITYKQILSVSQPLLQGEDDKRYEFQDSFYIPVRDGTKIYAFVVLPRELDRQQPVALLFTPYPSIGLKEARDAASHGYAGVVAFTRGTRSNSPGPLLFEKDAEDVYDVIDWISKQQWCNGKVGMYGGSYSGFAQWAALKKIHPALKTIVPQASVVPGYDSPMENNVHSSVLSFERSYAVANTAPLPADFFDKWYRSGRSFRALDTLSGHPNPLFQRWLDHDDYDLYWRSLIPTNEEFAAINIPILSTTGYYDDDQTGTIFYFRKQYMNNHGAHHYLVIGPYDHYGSQLMSSPNLKGYDIDPVADINMHDLAFNWLDFVMKKKRVPSLLVNGKIAFQPMGTNEWRSVGTLGKMSNDTLTFYLNQKTSGKYYTLSSQRPSSISTLDQTIDFADRTTQNNYFAPNILSSELNASNGLVFTTETFKDSFMVSGQFFGELDAIINKKDMDPWISLYEWLPDGSYLYLTRWLCRASYAKDRSKRQLLRPGQQESIPISCTRIISRMIRPGSRLLIILNVNKNPYDEINYGTGKDVSREDIRDAKEPLKVKWQTDSYIKLPILK